MHWYWYSGIFTSELSELKLIPLSIVSLKINFGLGLWQRWCNYHGTQGIPGPVMQSFVIITSDMIQRTSAVMLAMQ